MNCNPILDCRSSCSWPTCAPVPQDHHSLRPFHLLQEVGFRVRVVHSSVYMQETPHPLGGVDFVYTDGNESRGQYSIVEALCPLGSDVGIEGAGNQLPSFGLPSHHVYPPCQLPSPFG